MADFQIIKDEYQRIDEKLEKMAVEFDEIAEAPTAHAYDIKAKRNRIRLILEIIMKPPTDAEFIKTIEEGINEFKGQANALEKILENEKNYKEWKKRNDAYWEHIERLRKIKW